MTQITIGQRLDLLLSTKWLRRAIVALTLVCVGVVAGTMIPPPNAAWGEVKPQPPPQAFQSGDQLSVPILRDIATTLHQIDGRLSRLETVFKELTRPRPQSAGN
jgi:hypothetical protein